MSNSSLVNHTNLSPNHSGARTHSIDRITIHYMAGNLTVEGCGKVFQPVSRNASSNYGVDSDGRIGLYVNECNRSWASASLENDQRAVTIEVANIDAYGHITDKAFNALVNLCADICKRNGIEKLVWRNDKSNPGNMTVHRWFSATACPGEWFMSEGLAKVADAVNKNLSGTTAKRPVYAIKEIAKENTYMALRDMTVRTGHAKSANKSGTIKKGDKVRFIYLHRNKTGIWYGKIADGKWVAVKDVWTGEQYFKKGAVVKTYKSLKVPVRYAAGKLTVRKKPGSAQEACGYIKKGQKIRFSVAKKNFYGNVWGKIDGGTFDGKWVMMKSSKSGWLVKSK